MKSLKKHVLPIIILLLLTVFSGASASAANVARIGSKNYSSFSKALNSVKNNQTIKLLKNCTIKNTSSINSSLENKKDVTIDLNNHSVRIASSKSSYRTFVISNCRNISIKRGTIVGNVNFLGAAGNSTLSKVIITGNGDPFNESKTNPEMGGAGITHTGSGTVTLKNVSVENITANGYLYGKKCVLSIESGNYSFVCTENNAVTKIKGGKFEYLHQSGTRDFLGNETILDVRGGGRLTISGGTFKSIKRVVTSGSVCSISGGSFVSTGTDDTPVIKSNCGTLKITGGRFEGSSYDSELYTPGSSYFVWCVSVISAIDSKANIKNCTVVNKNTNHTEGLVYKERGTMTKKNIKYIIGK